MKKPIFVIGLTALSAALIVMLITQVLAATYIHLSLSGSVKYSATEIGARMFVVSNVSHGGGGTSINYVPLSGSGTVDSNGIYNENGNALEFANITGSINEEFTHSDDTMSIYIFVKNKGDRYIIPQISLSYNQEYLSVTESAYYFDKSAGQIDPIELKSSGNTASSIVDSVNSATKNEFPINAYIDNNDTYMLVITFGIVSAPGDSFVTDFNLNIAFMADVQYDLENEHLLTVCQKINQANPEWTKVGYNADLVVEATKVEVNTITALKQMYDTRDANGNTNNVHNRDDYTTAVVYKDIDIVNVDIRTGEIIGKLSDINYPFEWYGGDVTLPSGTTLASGRELATEETFTVDCYTYYPTMYIRRWMVGDTQYITLSDKKFAGSTKIDEWYTGTFESTIFNPDKSVAANSVGNIILRSYSNWWTPISGSSSAHLQTYYGFGTLTGSTNNPTQKQLLEWSNNLTTEWQNYAATNTDKAQYTTAAAYGVQGENWHKFVYNLLYFVKYADNNSQKKVGYGNTYTFSKYYANGIVIDVDNQSIVTGGSDALSRLESIRGSSVIGLYGSANTSAGENITYNAAGMAYGNQGGDYYSQTYLTYNNGSKKVLLDGYVGSDGCTSVWCLGVCNPWGNAFKYICGVVISFDIDTNKRYAYVNFDNYDYSSENYVVSHSIEPWETVNSMLISKNYVCLSYNLALSAGRYSYLDVGMVSSSDGRQSLIGLPSDKDIENKTTSTGLCDTWGRNNDYVCDSFEYSGATMNADTAGINCFLFGNTFNGYNNAHTIRTMLMS